MLQSALNRSVLSLQPLIRGLKSTTAPLPSDAAHLKGSWFEEEVHSLLTQWGATSYLVGSSGDRGVDIRGSWKLQEGHQVPLVVQCKNEQRKTSSRHLREFSGVLGKEGKLPLISLPVLVLKC